MVRQLTSRKHENSCSLAVNLDTKEAMFITTNVIVIEIYEKELFQFKPVTDYFGICI